MTRIATALTLFAVAGTAACGAGSTTIARVAQADGFPVAVTTCGFESEIDAPPQRIVTLNQGATEVALALGVADRMAGTAYLDDTIPAKWQPAYDAIPVLAAKYPNREQVAAARPDLLYASYASAFKSGAAGERDALAARGVPTVLSPAGCAKAPEKASWDLIWSELDAAAKAFGVPDRAAALRDQQQAALADPALHVAPGQRILWWDSDLNQPFVGAGTGAPQLLMNAVGATNVFADLNGNWAHVSWENIVGSDPDIIVAIDAKAYSAQEKIDRLRTDPSTRGMRAVRENRMISIPFSETTPGVRLVEGAQRLAAEIRALP